MPRHGNIDEYGRSRATLRIGWVCSCRFDYADDSRRHGLEGAGREGAAVDHPNLERIEVTQVTTPPVDATAITLAEGTAMAIDVIGSDDEGESNVDPVVLFVRM
jgi:hypothetical protein